MATSSFDRAFTVKSKKAAKILNDELKQPSKLVIKQRDVETESKRGADLLARFLSA